jgi:hypothetical protein
MAQIGRERRNVARERRHVMAALSTFATLASRNRTFLGDSTKAYASEAAIR